MLKHMLTQTGNHPRSGTRTPATATVVGIPTMEDLQGSPILSNRSSSSTRPVSLHGNEISNHNLYANINTKALSNGGLNLSQSAGNRINGSFNANLNLSSNSNSSPSGGNNQTRTTVMDSSGNSHHDLNTTQISPIGNNNKRRQSQIYNNVTLLSSNGDVPGRINSTFHANLTGTSRKLNTSALVPANVSKFMSKSKEVGVKEMITSLGLLCLVSLLLALLSLVFLLKISPLSKDNLKVLDLLTREEYVIVYEVTLAMCALTLSLNLCCLLVCAIQFIFALKLVKSTQGKARTNKYLKDASLTRTCAIAGFFISIPVFLTGIILYTFLHFKSTPAIVTSILIGLGIIFCGAAVVHNVFVWQKEKMKSISNGHVTTTTQVVNKNDIINKSKSNFGLPQATLDLSGHNNATITSAKGLELSTLV